MVLFGYYKYPAKIKEQMKPIWDEADTFTLSVNSVEEDRYCKVNMTWKHRPRDKGQEKISTGSFPLCMNICIFAYQSKRNMCNLFLSIKLFVVAKYVCALQKQLLEFLEKHFRIKNFFIYCELKGNVSFVFHHLNLKNKQKQTNK